MVGCFVLASFGLNEFVFTSFQRERNAALQKKCCALKKSDACATQGRILCASCSTSLGYRPLVRRLRFHEYFHGDTGAGLGASHQTGWTGLIAKLIQQQGAGGTIVKRDPFTDL
jgi:hypothetical protein